MAILEYDALGLPVVMWFDHYRAGGHLNPWVKVARRCSLEKAADGSFVFLYEQAHDESEKHVPWLAVLGGYLGAWLAKKFMQSRGTSVARHAERRPWGAVEAFRLTDDVAYLGVRTMSGGVPERRDAMVVVECGTAFPQLVVARGEMPPNVAGELHRVLTHEFVVRRDEHLRRLTAHDGA